MFEYDGIILFKTLLCCQDWSDEIPWELPPARGANPSFHPLWIMTNCDIIDNDPIL